MYRRDAVVDLLPNVRSLVRLNQGHDLLADISGKMQVRNIPMIKGDRGVVELSPYDLRRGRIRTHHR
jgi:translation initiation factor IF-1